MSKDTYVCNGCQKVLKFSDNKPIGDPSSGYTCPACSKKWKEIKTEVAERLALCGEDGKIALDYLANKMLPAQLSSKYNCKPDEAERRAKLAVLYMSSGPERRTISYDEWKSKMNED